MLQKSALKFCVVGSGPSGCYAVQSLVSKFKSSQVQVDVIEALPTPFGLVRYGVAPDHHDAKNVTRQFGEVLRSDGVQWFGNVKLGKDIYLNELRNLYDGVILAVGAQEERKLNIPGEGLAGVLSARDFVAWYNGHPEYRSLDIPIFHAASSSGSGSHGDCSVVVIGNGNVAIDVSRVLLKPIDELAKTDIAPHALDQLATIQNKTKHVHIVGRRGVAQAAWTTKELRELLTKMKNISYHVHAEEIQLSSADAEELGWDDNRVKKKCTELVQQAAANISKAASSASCPNNLHLRFKLAPVGFEADAQGKLCSAMMSSTTLQGNAGKQAAQLISKEPTERIPAQMALLSVGYKVKAIDGIQVNPRTGIIDNVHGRIKGDAGPECLPGLFVTGWMKRGSTGIIGSNKWDAEETVLSVFEDVEQGRLAVSESRAGRRGLQHLLDSRKVAYISMRHWEKIDRKELEDGAKCGMIRRKITSVEEMLQVAGV